MQKKTAEIQLNSNTCPSCMVNPSKNCLSYKITVCWRNDTKELLSHLPHSFREPSAKFSPQWFPCRWADTPWLVWSDPNDGHDPLLADLPWDSSQSHKRSPVRKELAIPIYFLSNFTHFSLQNYLKLLKPNQNAKLY